VVLEGDEYDTAFFDKRSKFVHYLPTALLINNIEFDHADIFGSLEEILLAFRRLVNIVPGNGIILANGEDPRVRSVMAAAPAPVETFGLAEGCTWRATGIVYGANQTSFDVEHDGAREATVTIPLLGEFNVRNALGVLAIARWLGVPYDAITGALGSFKNVKRRLELKGEWNGVKVYDDFAHHPTAIRETLKALRFRHPSERLWALFEPRSNTTRRNVFQQELADAFGDANVAVVAQIDRLEQLSPEERLDPERLIAEIERHGIEAHYLPDATAIAEYVGAHARPGDVIAVMSNGGFGGIHRKLADALSMVSI
jgi:UDP-N-acetylmuramate: L-alanyl-gamma-D-glutamyl-meso-diaminopimelate ligase